ncbi:hypothetical protein CTEN210_13052 [Chaetoceros tenuissimus]|uniref:Uncharacterized protein n=1 Tax=Chaetoceros tenuissimus TaxID=426638 RepID=A0AAD3D2E1_9STRA|nr:hypothetical protein CTEN210_13052 [Chaetoceros tenuissimus]
MIWNTNILQRSLSKWIFLGIATSLAIAYYFVLDTYLTDTIRSNGANTEKIKNSFNSATGKVFQGEQIRSFTGPRLYLTRDGHDKKDNKQKNTFMKKNNKTTFEKKLLSTDPNGASCTKWGVVTTIFEPSFAIKRAADLPSWCLVIVADTKTPKNYMQLLKELYEKQDLNDEFMMSGGNANDVDSEDEQNIDDKDEDKDNNVDTFTSPIELNNVFFFSVEKQKEWEKSNGKVGQFVRSMPWRHFCRKNLGYLFAILHGAENIFDFDDDNFIKMEKNTNTPVNILPQNTDPSTGETVLPNVSIVSQGPHVFNHHPVMKPSFDGTSWARGFPLDLLQKESTHGEVVFTKDIPYQGAKEEIGVIQYLADGNPDIDAIHRLEKPLPMTFDNSDSATPVLVPKHSYAPYNAQATIHTYNAFWATILPSTVPGRVSDIWRSYFAQCIFADAGLRLVFAPPKIIQFRSDHNYLGDFEAEHDLYAKSGKLLEYLKQWYHPDADDIPKRMEALWIDLYERGYIEKEDVIAVQKWLQALDEIGYEFPPLKRRFRNVAMMGQFNYPTPARDVIFWAQKQKETFDTVTAAGPFSDDVAKVLKESDLDFIQYEQEEHPGFIKPYENLASMLMRYKDSSKIEGVLYAHDDALLNFSSLSQGMYPFPSEQMLGTFEYRNYHDYDSLEMWSEERRMYRQQTFRIYQNGTFGNLDLNDKTHKDLDSLLTVHKKWYNEKYNECTKGQMSLTKDPAFARFLDKDDNSFLVPRFVQSDMLFVPTAFAEYFIEGAELHKRHNIWLECAVPNIVDMIHQQNQESFSLREIDLCTDFNEDTDGFRNDSKKLIDYCRSKDDRKGRAYGMFHPVKMMREGLKEYDRLLDWINLDQPEEARVV